DRCAIGRTPEAGGVLTERAGLGVVAVQVAGDAVGETIGAEEECVRAFRRRDQGIDAGIVVLVAVRAAVHVAVLVGDRVGASGGVLVDRDVVRGAAGIGVMDRATGWQLDIAVGRGTRAADEGLDLAAGAADQ